MRMTLLTSVLRLGKAQGISVHQNAKQRSSHTSHTVICTRASLSKASRPPSSRTTATRLTTWLSRPDVLMWEASASIQYRNSDVKMEQLVSRTQRRAQVMVATSLCTRTGATVLVAGKALNASGPSSAPTTAVHMANVSKARTRPLALASAIAKMDGQGMTAARKPLLPLLCALLEGRLRRNAVITESAMSPRKPVTVTRGIFLPTAKRRDQFAQA